ncbi:MAG: cbb3-type cytochrome c oxidase subunit I [Planctomycetota bacterium]|nr:cbb3-type cytochrome c oxidase subunit I [Planctomycetota bacterium]
MPAMPTTDRPRFSAALAFLVAGGVWFLVAGLYGLAGAVHLMAPEFFNNIPWLVFGRTRPVHVNTMLFGFVAGSLMGAALHYVPALLRAKLWSPRLAWVSFWLWQAAVLSGPVTFAFGITQAREYTEYIWPVDVCVVLAVGTLIVNLLMTLARRGESGLYVSVWYVVGAMLWTAALYPIGNIMWRPQTGAVPGILDSIILWFYGHNVVGLLLTPLALAAVYFIVPRITKTPLYSHTLSLIGFFSLAAIYSHIGGHHILQAPIPNWLRTLSVVDSVAMIVPVTVVLVNVWMTARGRLGMLWNDPAGRFILVGTFWYLITCVQGPLQSLPSVQKVTHFTNWTIGHAHIAVLGFAGFIAIGALWHVVPNLTGRRIYSRRLISLQFGLAMFGLVGFFLVLTAAGLVQGQAWQRGETVYRALPSIAPYMILRAMLGVSILASAAVGLYNLLMTVHRGEPIENTLAQEVQA